MNTYNLLIYALIFLISGCTEITTGLDGINNTLSDLNSGLNGGQSTTEIKSIVNSTEAGGAGKIMLSEASDNITGFLAKNACITSHNGSPLNIYAIPGKIYSTYSHRPPVKKTKYHNKDKCLHVKNISNIKVLAANAFEFDVVYISNESQEAVKDSHTLIKQSSGEWLFKY